MLEAVLRRRLQVIETVIPRHGLCQFEIVPDNREPFANFTLIEGWLPPSGCTLPVHIASLAMQRTLKAQMCKGFRHISWLCVVCQLVHDSGRKLTMAPVTFGNSLDELKRALHDTPSSADC